MSKNGTKKAVFQIVGTQSLIMHNVVNFMDPTNQTRKEFKGLTGKRTKTPEDEERIARLEWEMSLYLSQDGSLHIPPRVMQSMMVSAAKLTKRGQSVKRGLRVDQAAPLTIPGWNKDDLNNNWESGKFSLASVVVVTGKRIVRIRPQFQEWSAIAEFTYLPDVIDDRDISDIIDTGGRLVGLMDWRPYHGLFEVKS